MLATGLSTTAERALVACSALDGHAVEAVLDACSRQAGPEAAVTEVLVPVLREVARCVAAAELTTVHQQLFTGAAQRWLRHARRAAPPPTVPAPVLLACALTEHHAVELASLELLLRHRGLPVTDLGANTPSSDLLAAIRRLRPAAVVVSCHLPRSRPHAVGALRLARSQGVSTFAHGAGFSAPEEGDRDPLDHLDPDPGVAADAITRAVVHQRSGPSLLLPPTEVVPRPGTDREAAPARPAPDLCPCPR
ncbi:cobalamin-dependent protein [Microlunatus capsulatus]|uniref:Methylmalonyl-CoA mutase cobalamin-binding subunit n=1 Tax=Microlunatus capsulatus TaxID=99117 RepID=A0ABS4Z529_9ACTN|nr:cobalamin B12-binding domain-containing protein [Microlunatus capsulatus]MBP2416106.1 methylmalonyl-CoA mutase cobalamin-binding subunit [Microlunatus capsulatus]